MNWLRRATKRGKFSHSAWAFDVVLNSRQKKIPKQRIIQIYHIVSIFTQFFAYVRQLKNVTMNMKNGHFIVHWITEIFNENLSSNFSLIAVFVKVALKITKRAQHCILPRFTRFHLFWICASLLAFSWLYNVKGSFA